MSSNLFARLKALMPPPPVWVGEVLEINADGTVTVTVPGGSAGGIISPGLSVGSTARVRGTPATIGLRVLIRAGVIESVAPAGTASEIVVGTVVTDPFGPAALAFAGPLALAAGSVGVAYSFDLTPFWSGGYSPRTYSLVSGVLPAWATIAGSRITGTPSGAATTAGLLFRCTDSTRRAVSASAAVSLVVT
jgi:hypothetical protein